jgi:hypothetical protein
MDEPEHYTVFNVTLFGFPMLALFFMKSVGIGFCLLGFSLIWHHSKFR